jgi:hypothetical protein
MVKTLTKGDKPFDVFVPFWNFGHVLQIFPKHLKIFQYKSCAESPGAHFIFRVTLLVLSGKGAKLPRKIRIPVHRDMTISQLGFDFLFQYESNSTLASARINPSTTFLSTGFEIYV